MYTYMFMYVSIRIYVYTCMYVYIYIYIYKYVCVSMYRYIYTCVRIPDMSGVELGEGRLQLVQRDGLWRRRVRAREAREVVRGEPAGIYSQNNKFTHFTLNNNTTLFSLPILL